MQAALSRPAAPIPGVQGSHAAVCTSGGIIHDVCRACTMHGHPCLHGFACVLCRAVQDFEIDLDDDTGPTPAPRAPAVPAAAGPGSASKMTLRLCDLTTSKMTLLPPRGSGVPTTHMQYVRPGLEPQQSHPPQQPHFPGPPQQPGQMPMGMMGHQGSGGLMGHGSGQMGGPQHPQQQHFSLPVAGGGMMQQQMGGMPGHVMGPRPPPGGPRPPAGKRLALLFCLPVQQLLWQHTKFARVPAERTQQKLGPILCTC